MRNIDVVVPERSILNAMPPTACQYYWEVVMTIQHAIYRALNPVLGPGAVTAGAAPIVIHSYGHRPDGREWNSTGYLLTECGPWGATRDGDGDSGQQPVIGNLLVVGGVELFEVRANVVMLASEYVPDTAGPGYYRGGAGNAHDALWRVPAEHRLSLFHARRPMAGGGVFGGESGPTSAGWLFTADTVVQLDPPFIPMSLSSPLYAEAVPLGGVLDPVTHEVAADGEYVFQPGRIPSEANTVVRTFFGGGGGWGDPLERDPDQVRQDVRDGYVTFEGAARDYGVVVRGDLRHPEQISVDADATAALRAEQREARGGRST
jgi:N-methylhydantoinase B